MPQQHLPWTSSIATARPTRHNSTASRRRVCAGGRGRGPMHAYYCSLNYHLLRLITLDATASLISSPSGRSTPRFQNPSKSPRTKHFAGLSPVHPASSPSHAMPAHPRSCLLLLEAAIGFGPARLVMAPAGVAGSRLPRGAHAVAGLAEVITGGHMLRTPATSSRSRLHSIVVGALRTGGARTVCFLVPPVTAGGSSPTRGLRGAVAIRAVRKDFFPEDDDDLADDDFSCPADLSDDGCMGGARAASDR
jgi:hypothetical protein